MPKRYKISYHTGMYLSSGARRRRPCVRGKTPLFIIVMFMCHVVKQNLKSARFLINLNSHKLSSMPSNRVRPHITALLIDISGNLHVESTPTLNAVDAFQNLIGSGVPFRLCSNSSKESSASLVKKLNSMGFELTPTAGVCVEHNNRLITKVA